MLTPIIITLVTLVIKEGVGDFPGSAVTKAVLPVLDTHMPCGKDKKKKFKKKRRGPFKTYLRHHSFTHYFILKKPLGLHTGYPLYWGRHNDMEHKISTQWNLCLRFLSSQLPSSTGVSSHCPGGSELRTEDHLGRPNCYLTHPLPRSHVLRCFLWWLT